MHIKVLSRESSAELSIGEDIFQGQAFFSDLSKIASRFALITDSQVEKLYGQALVEELEKRGLETHLFAFPSGEQHKTRETKQALEDKMLSKGLGKDAAIIALGGGVVTDLAGFLASTYCRGIPFISIPTSLLGMVDASIGGKNGVNTAKAKNILGSFYHPKSIFIDTALLSTLPKNEMRNGTAEIIKYGLISSPSLFEYLEKNKELWEKLDPKFFQEIIYQSCLIKKEVVEEDPAEKGLRRILNFGHTIGHAVETLEEYQISHGEAIAIGMLVEGYISQQWGVLSKESLERMRALFKQYGFSLKLSPSFSSDKMMNIMARDKKSLSSIPRFVILKSIGQTDDCDGHHCTKVSNEVLMSALSWMQELDKG